MAAEPCARCSGTGYRREWQVVAYLGPTKAMIRVNYKAFMCWRCAGFG
jgi:hypothetical protein